MPLPLAIIDTMKNILACFTRLYFRRMSTQPRGQGGSTLSHWEPKIKIWGKMDCAARRVGAEGPSKGVQGPGLGVEAQKPPRQPPSLTHISPVFINILLQLWLTKRLILHTSLNIIQHFLHYGLLIPLIFSCSILHTSFNLFLSTKNLEFHPLF